MSILGIAAANYFGQPSGVRFGRLFVLSVCLASWRLGFRSGVGIAIASPLVTTVASAVAIGYIPAAAAKNFALHVLSLTVTAAFVSSFRQSFLRERGSARFDKLTTALTRPAFEHKAASMIAGAAMQRRLLLLAYLDLDGFKQVNDRHGHAVGDEVLKRFGAEGRAAVRNEDCFARLGGDEFAILLPVASRQAAADVVQGLHKRFAVALERTGYAVTCSTGALVIGPDDAASLDEIMCRADRLMYAAKQGGKDRIRFETSAPRLDIELPLFAGTGTIEPKPPEPIQLDPFYDIPVVTDREEVKITGRS